MPKANNFGSLGNTYKHGKGAMKIALEQRNRFPKNLDVTDVQFAGDKFIFTIRGKKFLSVTAGSGIKRKIVQKLCSPVPTPENPGSV